MMKVLLACEHSGTVRDAFRALGHDALSCDLLPSDNGGPHYQGDVRDLLDEPWDAVIAFPPCTHLAVSGAKHFAKKRADGRQQEGIDFFMLFTKLKCPRVAIENPVGIMSSIYRKPDQIIQPYQHGDPFTKTTCLWLKGLPLLRPTNVVDKGERHVTKSGKSLPKWYNDALNLPPAQRAIVRNKTFQGIANAMAQQWGTDESQRMEASGLFF